ncbi:Dabb family protein [Labilibaculum sp. K2S]|uniref:Dabb family protein n=1 Tax=Labilibaculum sp. K2S TaxID=3056386 RepID=UPI0025A3C2BC|nr:Dabb family protein [Labilibaculum sp. K2S]MDM8158842.1 Dabb family protein [Labilibaculum sp. K2S]
MIKHIAMFKFKAFESAEEKESYFNRLKKAFDGLDERIPEIKFLQIGFDQLRSDASFDFIVNVDIENIDALPLYANHPEHLKAASVVKEMAAERKVIDYEF